jgi:hypothetical protein
MFNNQKVCLTWTLPRRIKPSFLREKIISLKRSIQRKIIWLVSEANSVDKLTFWRHVVLSIYGWGLTPFLLLFFGQIDGWLFMAIFQIINISIFFLILKNLKEDHKDSLILGWVYKIFKNKEKTKKFFLFFLEPLLWIVDIEKSNYHLYFINKTFTSIVKGIDVAFLIIISSTVASITWSAFIGGVIWIFRIIF